MSPRLFTASDVERAARLAAVHATAFINSDPETVVRNAVNAVTDDAAPYYSEDEVKQILQFVLHEDDVDADFEAALHAIRR